jgi:hypothetical protein
MTMKRKILFLFLAASLTLGSCHKSTCPTYDTGGDGGTKGGSKQKSKTPQGMYPKKVQKELDKKK